MLRWNHQGRISRMLFVGMAVLASGMLMAGASGAADKTDKKAKAEKKVSTPAAGTVKVQSTKASGAGIVAKSRACVGDPPKIEKVRPDEGKAGDKILILGRNFGGPGCSPTVSFGPGNPAKVTPEDDTKISVTVPQGKKGVELLTLTNSSGGDSKPFLMK